MESHISTGNAWYQGESNNTSDDLAGGMLIQPRAKVSVVPNHESGLDNKIFRRDFVVNTHWMDSFRDWRKAFHGENIELATYDLIPLEDSDLVIVMDLPEKRSVVLDIKKKAKGKKLMLFLHESPFCRPHWFRKENHEDFDLIMTYNPYLIDGERYLRFFFSIGTGQINIPSLSYEERKPCVLVNTNYYEGVRGYSRPWHYWQFYKRMRDDGWVFDIQDVWRVESCIDYAQRRKLARGSERYPQGLLDIYGANWNGRDYGWYYHFFPDHPYLNAKGPYKGDKLTLLSQYRFVLAYENYISDEGYISEKILDPLLAGTVPIYKGDKHVTDHIDPACFVDARKFSSPHDLFHFVESCSTEEWMRLRQAGQSFIQSKGFHKFTSEYFGKTMLHGANHLLK